MMLLLARLFSCFLVLAAGTAGAQQKVELPSLDAGVRLPALWFAAAGAGPRPAVVLLHGCGGAFDRHGHLTERFRDTVERLSAMGVAALVPDSLAPRGETQICTQRLGTRAVTQTQRRRDALGALKWLAARPEVDPRRLGLLGWSNGGSTVLAATNRRQAEVAAAGIAPAFAAAFYPGCQADLARGYEPTAPLLLLVGAADDWTPAEPCRQLARAAGVQIETYAGAYHGFDGSGPVRLRTDVPNGVHPGQGVHVGGDPAARTAALERLDDFVRERFALPAVR